MNNKEKSEIQDSIIDSLPKPAHGLVQLAPRVGKSRIAIKVIKNEKSKSILWVTPSTNLRDVEIPAEFHKWKAKTYLKKTTIVCYGSLSSTKGHFDKVILDEYQDVTPVNAEPLFNGNITYNSIIGLSGTHPEHKEKNEIYTRLQLGILADMGIDEAVDKGIIADYNITVLEVAMEAKEKTIAAGSKDKPFMTTERAQYDYLDKTANQAIWGRRKDAQFRILARMRAVYNSFSKEQAAQFLISTLPGRKLVFCGSIDQANRLSDYPYHSKTNEDNLNAFKAGEIDILTCVNSGGIGSTYRSVDHFIIVQSDSDKKGGTTQKLARALLEQGAEYKADIWFLLLLDTKDASWIEKALRNFDSKKVKYERFINLKNSYADSDRD